MRSICCNFGLFFLLTNISLYAGPAEHSKELMPPQYETQDKLAIAQSALEIFNKDNSKFSYLIENDDYITFLTRALLRLSISLHEPKKVILIKYQNNKIKAHLKITDTISNFKILKINTIENSIIDKIVEHIKNYDDTFNKKLITYLLNQVYGCTANYDSSIEENSTCNLL
ncbi:MAG: hypothetical protein KC505_10430 [Myxococcales bacterium]|nr:hypothetical protein [Myxococcales bacterium]USN50415.1 MAG: hypothetical protein H6731_09155 [Myxococcales bacterium]